MYSVRACSTDVSLSVDKQDTQAHLHMQRGMAFRDQKQVDGTQWTSGMQQGQEENLNPIELEMPVQLVRL